ncbi:unnamed protein product [Linum trigynum]|uniref:Uncharacterized protein n=1 Tax=Linum trigynum TaxID=586398 RepID=A0AAV2FQ09_9ROSI
MNQKKGRGLPQQHSLSSQPAYSYSSRYQRQHLLPSSTATIKNYHRYHPRQALTSSPRVVIFFLESSTSSL